MKQSIIDKYGLFETAMQVPGEMRWHRVWIPLRGEPSFEELAKAAKKENKEVRLAFVEIVFPAAVYIVLVKDGVFGRNFAECTEELLMREPTERILRQVGKRLQKLEQSAPHTF